ncbi:MAG TPA: hypothetical protein VNS46_08325 [Nocardioides sp.]|nr:hypothetical protein [Nocardioides sp.]
MRRIPLHALPAVLLLLPLAACGDDGDDTPAPEPLTDGAIWLDGSEIHFPGGEVVDAGLDAGQAWRTSHGVVTTSWEGGAVYVTPDGTVTDLDLPKDTQVATDREQSLIAWTAPDGDGVVHVLDPATGEEQAAIETDYPDAMSISLDGDTVWLYGSELATTLEIDWRSGEVTRSPLEFVRSIDRHYATVEGGNENFVEAGAAKPGIIDIDTGELVRRGWSWRLSPRATYGASDVSDGDSSTQDTRIVIVDLATGKAVARFPARPDDSGWLTWSWTSDEGTISWFEGTELVQCTIATSQCTRDEVDAKQPRIV